jgi:hypothetical protein
VTRGHQSWPDDRDPARQRWIDYRRDRLEANPEKAVEVEEPVDSSEEPAPDLEGFDPVAAAREHWDGPLRHTYLGDPFIRGSTLLARATRGGQEGEEALLDMLLKWRRSGWHPSIDNGGNRTWHRL